MSRFDHNKVSAAVAARRQRVTLKWAPHSNVEAARPVRPLSLSEARRPARMLTDRADLVLRQFSWEGGE